MYIYLITNKINDKQYVGQTIQKPSRRWTNHKADSKHRKSTLQHAMRKYGVENFSFEVVDECHSSDELNEAEIEWISKLDTFNNGYNMTVGGEHPFITDEQKQKLRDANLGKKYSKETRKRVSEANKKRWNADPEGKERARQRMLGNTLRKGKTFKHTEKTKEKMRQQKLGKPRPQHVIEAARLAKSIPILQFSIFGKLMNQYPSLIEAQRQTGIDERTIRSALKKTSGLRKGRGYLWAYKSDYTPEQLLKLIKESER